MPSKTANRLSTSFSPMRADSASTSAATVWPSTSVASSASTSAGLLCRPMSSRRSASVDEVGVLGDEVGLAVELEQGAVLADDDAVGRRALEALADVLGALDAQELDGLVVVAVGLGERLLAVHHAGAGGVAETLDVGCGEVSHVTSSGSGGGARAWCGRAAAPSRRSAGTAPADQAAGAGVALGRCSGLGRRSGLGGSGGLGRSGGLGGAARRPRRPGPRRRRPPVRSSRSQSASGSSPPMAGSAPSSARPALACAAERAMRPSATASAITRVSSGDAADGVVVARDLVVDLVGVAVGVEDRDDRDVQLAGLADGDVLLLGVHDPDGAGHLLHVADTAEGALELGLLAGEDQLLLLGQADQRAGLLDVLELLEALQPLVARSGSW